MINNCYDWDQRGSMHVHFKVSAHGAIVFIYTNVYGGQLKIKI